MKEKKSQIKESDKQIENTVEKPWLWKKGQSGNLKGRPIGKTMKEYAKEYLSKLTDEERDEWLEGLDKEIVWKMSEGNPKQDTEVKGHVTISQLLDELDGQKVSGQTVEDQPPVQDSEQTGEASPVQVEPSTVALPTEQVES